MKEEQQVPPGILIMRTHTGHEITPERDYEKWYNDHKDDYSPICIKVDGRIFSTGETVLYDGDSHDFEVKITSFKWANGMWMIYHRSGNCIARYLTKLAPPSSLDRSGEFAINFIEWASLHCFNKFVDNHWSWGYKEKYKRMDIGWLTTEQLLREYLNQKL